MSCSLTAGGKMTEREHPPLQDPRCHGTTLCPEERDEKWSAHSKRAEPSKGLVDDPAAPEIEDSVASMKTTLTIANDCVMNML